MRIVCIGSNPIQLANFNDFKYMKNRDEIPNNLAIHCPTKHLAEKVVQCLYDLGYTWCSGEEYSSDKVNWEFYAENTCYDTNGYYGGLSYYKQSKCQIISGEDFLKQYSPNNKSNLKLSKPNKKIKLKFTL